MCNEAAQRKVLCFAAVIFFFLFLVDSYLHTSHYWSLAEVSTVQSFRMRARVNIFKTWGQDRNAASIQNTQITDRIY